MIYELNTQTLNVGMVPEFEARFAEALPFREKYSKLGGFWHTEFGPLSQVMHVWAYENHAQREQVQGAAAQDPHWPPNIHELVLNEETEILLPAHFMRPLEPRETGDIYEMRIYTYRPGTIPEVLERWGRAIEYREQFSPLLACWQCVTGKPQHEPLMQWYCHHTPVVQCLDY